MAGETARPYLGQKKAAGNKEAAEKVESATPYALDIRKLLGHTVPVSLGTLLGSLLPEAAQKVLQDAQVGAKKVATTTAPLELAHLEQTVLRAEQ